MVKVLPFVIIPILVLGGLFYWRTVSTRQNSDLSEQGNEKTQEAAEVPNTLPAPPLEERVKSLEADLNKLKPLSSPKASGGQTAGSSSLESRVQTLESTLTDLKSRVSALEQSNSAPASSTSKYPLYIPLGSGGGPWADMNWFTLTEYQVSINTDNYSGYSGMQLEVNFRLADPVGTGSVRLYNLTDKSVVASQVDSTTDSFDLKTSAVFKLPSGQKTYTLQIKSTAGKNLFIQSARIKVNF